MRLILIIFAIVLTVLSDNSYFDTECDTSLNRCFKYVSSPATYTDAEERCNEKGGHLVSIENGFVGALIGESATHAFSDPNFPDFWIGANFLLNNRWSWTDGTTFAYSNWAPGQPSKNEVAAMQINAKNWVSSDPSTVKPYVCELSLQSKQPEPANCPRTARCETGWMFYNLTDSCYKSFFNATFDHAEIVCNSNGAHLTSIHNDAENTFVSDLAATGQREGSPETTTWIGMYRVGGNSPWIWTDGTKTDYTAWGGGNTNAPYGAPYNCVSFFADGWTGNDEWNQKWENWPCDGIRRNYICRKPAS